MSLLVSLLLFAGSLKPAAAPQQSDPEPQSGTASYYATKFNGCRTSNGERVKQHIFTGAHRTLPFNTLVEITNQLNRKSVIIRINDRGPFHKGRIVDMTEAAAKAIGLFGKGLAKVTLRVVSPDRLLSMTETPLTFDNRSPLLPSLMTIQ